MMHLTKWDFVLVDVNSLNEINKELMYDASMPFVSNVSFLSMTLHGSVFLFLKGIVL